MRVVIEMAPADYDAMGDARTLDVPVTEIEVRVEDGLLSSPRNVLWAEGLGAAVLQELGLQGPAIRLHLGEEGDTNGSA